MLAETGTVLDLLIITMPGSPSGTRWVQLDYDAIRRQLEEVRTRMGPLRVTEALLGRLKPGSTVAFITSRIGSLGDNRSGGLYGYRISKCAANMVAVNLAHDLGKRGIAAVVLSPSVHSRIWATRAGCPGQVRAVLDILAWRARAEVVSSRPFEASYSWLSSSLTACI